MQTAPPTLAQGSIRNDVCEPRFAPSPHDPKARIHSNYAASPQLNPKDGRPRVLILPNVASWIVGQMAMHIMERFEDRYEFWMLTDKMLRLRPDLVRALLPGLDFIFPLTDKSYKLLRKAAGPLPLPPSIFWVHHVTTWNPSMLAAAHNADELIVCTPEWKTEIEKQCPGSAVTVIPHGVDAHFFHRLPSQRAKFGVPENAFVVSSRIEGGPVTVLEAMACETAVVTTRVGLVPHTIVDGKNGFSTEIGDIEAMVRALRGLRASPQLLASVGRAARAAVYPHRSWGKVLDGLEEPLARMEARSTRATAGSSSSSAKTAAQLAGAVHTIDGLLWGLVSWWQGLLSPRVAVGMVKACWEGYSAADVFRGLGLITRSWLRPADAKRSGGLEKIRMKERPWSPE